MLETAVCAAAFENAENVKVVIDTNIMYAAQNTLDNNRVRAGNLTRTCAPVIDLVGMVCVLAKRTKSEQSSCLYNSSPNLEKNS
jgi:hypothetical protein